MNPDNEPSRELASMLEMVEGSDLSSIKSVVSGVINVINDPESSAKDLKDIIEIDPPLTARVLKLANSAYYFSPKKISEIQHAIIWIGFEALKELALSQKVGEVFGNTETIDGYSAGSLWKHSVAVALFGKMIYRREFGKRGENVYALGLLHDIGIIIEHQYLPKDFHHILSEAKARKENLAKAESRVLGYNHADIGNAVTDLWNFPPELTSAIGHHHNPEVVPQPFNEIASTLYVADYLCQEEAIGYGDAPQADKTVFQKCLKRLGLEYDALDLIAQDVRTEIRKMEDQGLFDHEES